MPKVADEQATFMSKAKPPRPRACLDLDRHGRVGALHVGGRAQHRVDRSRALPQRSSASRAAFTAISARIESSSFGRSGMIGRITAGSRIPDLSHHEARLDARGLLDELGGGGRDRLDAAFRDRRGIFRVEPFDVGVKGRDQLGVGNASGGV